jgi:hypothetical protein
MTTWVSSSMSEGSNAWLSPSLGRLAARRVTTTSEQSSVARAETNAQSSPSTPASLGPDGWALRAESRVAQISDGKYRWTLGTSEIVLASYCPQTPGLGAEGWFAVDDSVRAKLVSMEKDDDLRAAAIEALSSAISLLERTDLDEALQAHGWSPELAEFIAGQMIECRTRIEEGWTPPPQSGGGWIRIMMDSINTNDDPLLQAVTRGGAAVTALANTRTSD